MDPETLALSGLILDRYKTVRHFARVIGLPASTVNSILINGIGTARFETALRIYKVLNRPLPISQYIATPASTPVLLALMQLDEQGVASVAALIAALQKHTKA